MKVGTMVKQLWSNDLYVVTSTNSKKAGFMFATYELYSLSTGKFSYPVERIVEREYIDVQAVLSWD